MEQLIAVFWIRNKKPWLLHYERFIKNLINMNIKRESINQIFSLLQKQYPNPKTSLKYKNKFTLLIAVLLSAQCTDKNVNNVTKKIFKKYYKPNDYVKLGIKKITKLIKSIGLYNNKAKNIFYLSKQILQKYNGRVPDTFDDTL